MFQVQINSENVISTITVEDPEGHLLQNNDSFYIQKSCSADDSNKEIHLLYQKMVGSDLFACFVLQEKSKKCFFVTEVKSISGRFNAWLPASVLRIENQEETKM